MDRPRRSSTLRLVSSNDLITAASNTPTRQGKRDEKMVRVCKVLLEQAESGRISGLVFAAFRCPGFGVYAIGEAEDKPELFLLAAERIYRAALRVADA